MALFRRKTVEEILIKINGLKREDVRLQEKIINLMKQTLIKSEEEFPRIGEIEKEIESAKRKLDRNPADTRLISLLREKTTALFDEINFKCRLDLDVDRRINEIFRERRYIVMKIRKLEKKLAKLEKKAA